MAWFGFSDGVVSYMQQYVKTATDGKVYVRFAVATNRMQLVCKVCDQTLTFSSPGSAEKIDWAMQEFVKLHRHVPLTTGEGTPTQIKGTGIGSTSMTVSTPVTASFKKIKPKTPENWGIEQGRKFR